MPVYALDEDTLLFPPAGGANEEGLVAVGGRLSEDWLLTAYSSGLFPWFNPGDPVLWWSPDPRMVLQPSQVHVSKSMRPMLNNKAFEFSFDENFEKVMRACARAPRSGQSGTWITDEMIEAYCNLHKIGMAHSAEIHKDGKLIGGLYGVAIGGAFFGESMFSKQSNVSKLCFIRLCNWLYSKGFELIDCQVYSEHLARLGAHEIPRSTFIGRLKSALDKNTMKGKWTA